MARKIVSIDAVKLACGIQQILLDMAKKGVDDPSFPIRRFEDMIQESHGVSKSEAERVTERVISTGIIRWALGANTFVL